VNAVIRWLHESPFATATWVDWVDITLLALVIYWTLTVIRGTRAMQSLIGLGLLGALYLLSRVTGLAAIHWVLDNLSVYLVLAVLILFQDDIRRALAGAGGTLFTRTTRPSEASVLEEVIKACFSLAGRRIGALVVFERTGSLHDYLAAAHRVDAAVSTELLQAVFHPSSPLHDGAVVITGARVAAAGVFLPIALGEEVSRTLGTRHRAAIGLTEVTDGVCLVVSEERGTVTLVDHGELVPVADPNDLRHRLAERLEGKRRRWLRIPGVRRA
jgi:diadenylate cyclase